MSEIVTLYHGTFHDFTDIDVTAGKPFKDFGPGFYTSQSYEHARTMATRNLDIEQRRLRRMKSERKLVPWIYTYELDFSKLALLKVKRFETADVEWVRFIILNRTTETLQHDYDVVIGPTANDKTLATVQTYLSGNYGKTDNDEVIGIFLRQIEPYKLPRQVFFGTQCAAKMLEFKGRSAAT
jgi:hypothetical protein